MHTPRRLRGRCRGFTLIELLVVVAVIAILAALLMPTLVRAMEKSSASTCSGHLRQLTQACIMYAGQFNNIISFCQWRPSYKSNFMQQVVQAHGKVDVRELRCPAEAELTPADWDRWEESWARTNAPQWWYAYNRAYCITELGRPHATTGKHEIVLTTDFKNPAAVVFWCDAAYYGVYYRMSCDPSLPEDRDSNMKRRISFRHMDGLNLIFYDYHGEWMTGKEVHPRMWCPTKWK